MGQVTVRVNGYQHTVGCKDGEEQHLQDLVSHIEEKVRVIRAMGGQFSESRMLLHVALLLADELGDVRTELARARRGLPPGAPLPEAPPPAPATDPAIAERLVRLAERIEGLAQGLNRGPA